MTFTALAALRRTLSTVYTFHDICYLPFDSRTPRIRSPLEVSIPELGWVAYPAPGDATYRFSALDWEQPEPKTFTVAVRSLAGDYASYELVTLPLPPAIPSPLPPAIASPLLAASFLVACPLWPTTAFRPAAGETAVSGTISHSTLPVAGLRVQLSTGAPDPAAPYTYTDDRGGFLFRLPYLGAASSPTPTVTLSIDVRDGATPVPVSPASVVVTLGRIGRFAFVRS